MKPLIVLLSVFGICLLSSDIITGDAHLGFSGKIGMAVMLIFTAIGHFSFTKGMTMMIPKFIPFKTDLIYLTGIFEIVAAIALFIPGFSELISWSLIVFFILMLPANINAAIKHVNYEKVNYEGMGPIYLWFRIPLQILFIVWICFFTIKQ